MMRAEYSFLPFGWVISSKNTPGERWSWLTITRSAPLMMNVPLVGDERQLAEVDLLLDDVLVALHAVDFLAGDEAQASP